MKPYGVFDLDRSRSPNYTYEFLSDFGFNSSTCEIPSGKSGKRHCIVRDSKRLRSIRRIWKKRYRNQVKHYIRQEINDCLILTDSE